jgi:putative oxidoreductase
MHRLFSSFIGGPGALGLLLLRLFAGSALTLHGWPKMQHAFDWMGSHAFAPGWLQAMSAFAEFGGGIALILGLLTPIFSFLILCNMAVAIFMVHLPKGDPFVATPGAHSGSLEPALSYLTIALLLMLIGPGVLSVDAMLFRQKRLEQELQHKRAKVAQ